MGANNARAATRYGPEACGAEKNLKKMDVFSVIFLAIDTCRCLVSPNNSGKQILRFETCTYFSVISETFDEFDIRVGCEVFRELGREDGAATRSFAVTI
jgi:hypothetical protein